jgi:GNAT superfamily N-acetyltransferase
MPSAPDHDEAFATVIRLAECSDAEALAELRYALRSSTGTATEPRADFLERCTDWMRNHLREGGRWQCWVAEANERLIGAVWLQLVEKIPNPRAEMEQHAYLTNFYVDESARGRGLGSRLLRLTIEWCESHEVDTVILWPTQRSRSLYQRHGFAVREDIMELILPTRES